jgi:hypothetical protein
VTGAQDGRPTVDAEPPGDRPADDHDRRCASRRGGDGAGVELGLQHRLHRRQHDREVGRLTPSHHGIDGDLLDGDGAIPWR